MPKYNKAAKLRFDHSQRERERERENRERGNENERDRERERDRQRERERERTKKIARYLVLESYCFIMLIFSTFLHTFSLVPVRNPSSGLNVSSRYFSSFFRFHSAV